MGVISISEGCVSLVVGDTSIVLSAEEVFGVAFEGVGTVKGVAICPEDFIAAGLQVSEYMADPVVMLSPTAMEGSLPVDCQLIARGAGFEAPVSRYQGHILDYAIDGNTWMALPLGTKDIAKTFLGKVELLDFSPITLGQYLRILKLRDLDIALEDRTNQALSALQISTVLQGDIPTGFTGVLYPYQAAGYRWLSYMRTNGLGCIIADEMGLGKTIQVICLLLESHQSLGGPSLVVSPATLLENWRREIHRFGPALTVCVHRGSSRTGFPGELAGCDVVVSSYETAVADVSLLRNVAWDLVVIDEAQAIKNPDAKRTRRLKTIPRRCAVAMTGTPVENRLTDLWSIADFAVPSLLGDLADFERRHPDTLDGATTLEPVLTPIILRRMVAEVAQDLPERIDIPQPLEMDAESAGIYEVLRTAAAVGGRGTLASLVKLRMFCTHPWLTDQFTHFTHARDCSVKLDRLLEIVEEIVSSDGKALVFTSYQQSIDLLASELVGAFGIYADTIDGRTPVGQRQAKVDAFSCLNGPGALVLNPKAAGTGLNITAANHVIHFNLEWNPAVEDQATARSHRRGQTDPVMVHRLYYVDTVEDVINDRMARKRQLASAAVVGTDGEDADVQDILKALRISPLTKQRR